MTEAPLSTEQVIASENAAQTALAVTDHGHGAIERNDGMALDLDWVLQTEVNEAAVIRHCAQYQKRLNPDRMWQAAWLVKAIQCIDLTTLAGDDTVGRVRRLCSKARHPLRSDIQTALGLEGMTLKTGAVCVYHDMIDAAKTHLEGSTIPVAVVSTGFPAGLSPFELRVKEIEASVQAGAQEIDIVISRRHVLTGNWQALYAEVQAFRTACGPAHLKTILATGELGTLRNVAIASLICMMAGADFIKTSTGKESVNATLPVSLVMVRAIRAYGQRTSFKVGYKPAGGISKAEDALLYLILMQEELGPEWLTPDLFRFGASSLLGNIESFLEECVTGQDSPAYRHASA